MSGFPAAIVPHSTQNHLLVALLAVVAALMGLAFANVLYEVEDLFDALWKAPGVGAPRRRRSGTRAAAARAAADVRSRLPVMYKTATGEYALWFLVILAFGKIAARLRTDRRHTEAAGILARVRRVVEEELTAPSGGSSWRSWSTRSRAMRWSPSWACGRTRFTR